MIKNRKRLLLTWSNPGWQQYQSYQWNDYKSIKRINRLIKSIQRDGHQAGLGNPEPLKHLNHKIYAQYHLHGEIWSRRINQGYRLVYVVPASRNRHDFIVISCKYHYKK